MDHPTPALSPLRALISWRRWAQHGKRQHHRLVGVHGGNFEAYIHDPRTLPSFHPLRRVPQRWINGTATKLVLSASTVLRERDAAAPMASFNIAAAQDRALEEEANIEQASHIAVRHITARDSHHRASAVSQDVGTLGPPQYVSASPLPRGCCGQRCVSGTTMVERHHHG